MLNSLKLTFQSSDNATIFHGGTTALVKLAEKFFTMILYNSENNICHKKHFVIHCFLAAVLKYTSSL